MNAWLTLCASIYAARSRSKDNGPWRGQRPVRGGRAEGRARAAWSVVRYTPRLRAFRDSTIEQPWVKYHPALTPFSRTDTLPLLAVTIASTPARTWDNCRGRTLVLYRFAGDRPSDHGRARLALRLSGRGRGAAGRVRAPLLVLAVAAAAGLSLDRHPYPLPDS